MIVLWRITERCNLSCPFCAYDRRIDRSRRDADSEVIRRFGVVLSEYRRSTGDEVLVSWIGGEPFLFPRLTELTILFYRELGLLVSATTNGTTLSSPAQRDHILSYYSELTVSVDGVGAVHNHLRGWHRGYDALRAAVTELAEAKRNRNRGPKLRANVLLMRQTVPDFERLCFELAAWGIDEITFNQLGGRERPEFFPAHRLLAEDAVSLTDDIPRLQMQLAQLGVNLRGGADYFFRIKASSRGEKIPVANCRPAEQFLFIDENGFASPCNFTTQGYGISIAELDCVEALTKLPWRFSRLQAEERLTACEDCHSTNVFAKFANQS